ncbi:MAG: zf-HC2 domain-containing protein [Deltaproteobacteria bacterium]|nr:zf-HC2 domain-containing protein [Deltaproteobacteria bacterium]
MQCSKVSEKISAYLDHELDFELSRQMALHIGQCDDCREMFQDFQKIDATLREMPEIELAADFARQLGRMVEVKEGPATGRLSILASLGRSVQSFTRLLDATRFSSTQALDEFNDFPPFSMGYIYFKLLEQSGRG